jgi:acetyl-CoA C-acetyltransferase
MGCGQKVPAWTVMRNCASGMQAIDSGIANILSGRADLVLAGGVDALSRAPLLYGDKMVLWFSALAAARTTPQRIALFGKLPIASLLKPVIGIMKGLTDPMVGLLMGQTAENLAHRFGITRAQMDLFSVRSHRRVAEAQQKGWLAPGGGEVEALYDASGKVYALDDGVRSDASAESLAKLKPFFDRKYGNVTPGNSSQITDGAAWLILASDEAVRKYRLDPIGRIMDAQWAGLDPAQMGLGPVHAVARLLTRLKIGMGELSQMELNEAFAAQVLACQAAWESLQYARDELGLSTPLGSMDPARLNPQGGAIASGHPVGASGARLVLHLVQSLQRQGGGLGVATLCIGGGQGGAMLLRAEPRPN